MVKTITAEIFEETPKGELIITVTGNVSPAVRGKRDKHGVQLEPDDSPDIEFAGATVDGWGGAEEYELPPERQEDAMSALWDAFAATPPSYPDDI